MVSIVLGALSIGLTLGLLGSGGSILTVPVLSYLVGQEQKLAIAGSLAIVGIISFFTMIPHIIKGKVAWDRVLYFGLPGMAGTYLGAWISKFVPGAIQFIIFALVMLYAAYKMLTTNQELNTTKRGYLHMIADGLLVGILTGFVGVGGGFLIVPALVLLGGLPIQTAIATSLVIIFMKSASGFFKYQQLLAESNIPIDWNVIAIISAVGIIGSFSGIKLGQLVNQTYLQRIFAVFLIVMAVYIGYQSVIELTGV
ncbi:sulfite exporter TauE/SafE family protein [Vibrio maerlii]|uniref:sulfite exporter TauE/SafE family protein n=1 Tax=Vibrio maerlii TaxID=2231648 RepID=UPI000E3CEBD3|nr:sulfite exporter TauE/SafE family protein [Vibrio maerlii]